MKDIIKKPKHTPLIIEAEKEKEGDVIKIQRRGLLKLILFGGGALIAGKLFGSFSDFFLSDKILNDIEFKNFRFVETRKKLTLYGDGGEELLIVEKDGVED